MSELRDQVEDILIAYGEDFEESHCEPSDEVADRIIALIQKEQGWRDVIGEMPEPGQHVLMIAPGKTLVVGYLSEVIGYGWRTCPGDHKWKPTHWQPLPTPPQGEDG